MKRLSRFKSVALFVATLTLICLTRPSTGRTDPKKEAKAAFMQGVDAFAKEDYPGALAAFEKSYRIRKKASVLYNIGMCQKALYRYSDSLSTFKKYLKAARGTIKSDRKQEVNEAITQMQRLVGKLKLVEAKDGSEVIINGRSIGKTPFKDPILLDPGRHTIEITKKNFEPLRTDITSASGAVVSLRAALAPAKARLRVECEEAKGLVSVDGKTVGGCPYEGAVEPGLRTVAIEAPSKKRFEKTVEAVSGSTSIVSATLERSKDGGPASATTGNRSDPVVKSTRKAWQDLNVTVKKKSISKPARIGAIDGFLAEYRVAKRYVKKAESWRSALAAGVEPETHDDPGYMRNQKEYISLRGYVGNYGGGGRIDFATRRWDWFFLGGFASAAGGADGNKPSGVPEDESIATRFFGALGLTLGIPINLGKKNHHEIRVGLGLSLGGMIDYNYKVNSNSTTGTFEQAEYSGMSAMIIFVPEIYYVWHAAKRFAIQVGFDMYFGPVTPGDLSVDSDSNDVNFEPAEPAFNGFIGLRF